MTSHPSPFYRQRQSNKSLDPTGQTAKFLYTILKQLDLKNIDWNEVADGLEISNGHAARMRWSRFRAQIEGLDNSYSRKGGRKKEPEKKRKRDKIGEGNLESKDRYRENTEGKRMKTKVRSGIQSDYLMDEAYGSISRKRGSVMRESQERTSLVDGVTVHHPIMTTITVPQTPAEALRSKRQVNAAHSPLISPSQPDVGVTSHQNKQVYMMANPYTLPISPQQYFSHGYGYPMYRPSTTSSPHFTNTGMYANSSQYPNMFMNQSQPRYNYYRQTPQNPAPFQQFHGYHYLNPSAPVSPSNSMNSLSCVGPHFQRSIQSTDTSSVDATSIKPDALLRNSKSNVTGAATSQPQFLPSQVPEKAFELAAQASYPWPFSENSLPQFVQQTKNQTSSTATDHVKEAAMNTHGGNNAGQNESQARKTENASVSHPKHFTSSQNIITPQTPIGNVVNVDKIGKAQQLDVKQHDLVAQDICPKESIQKHTFQKAVEPIIIIKTEPDSGNI